MVSSEIDLPADYADLLEAPSDQYSSMTSALTRAPDGLPSGSFGQRFCVPDGRDDVEDRLSRDCGGFLLRDQRFVAGPVNSFVSAVC